MTFYYLKASTLLSLTTINYKLTTNLMTFKIIKRFLTIITLV